MIKFLNQLSERDKAAAIKYLIATLKNSTKEQFTYLLDEDRRVWFDTTRIFDYRKTSAATTRTPLTVESGNTERRRQQQQHQNAFTYATNAANTNIYTNNTNNNNNGEYSDVDVEDNASSRMDSGVELSISLENLKSEGNFGNVSSSTALVPFHSQQKSYQQRALVQKRLRIGTPFGRDIKILFDADGDDLVYGDVYGGQRDLLKVFLTRFLLDQSSNLCDRSGSGSVSGGDRSLVRLHQHIDHTKPEAKFIEIKNDETIDDIVDGDIDDEDIDDDDDDDDTNDERIMMMMMETDDTTQRSEESLPDGNDKNDGDPLLNKSPRKRKLYKCYQCPKL